MKQNEFVIEGYDYQFRIKRMNAIDVLAIQSQIKFNTSKNAKKLFETILENIEVKCNDSWLPVKTEDMNVFFPPEIEEDVILVKKLNEYFINDFISPVFQKSNESK